MLRSLAGGTLFGEVWGEGPGKILALHGWARDHTDFSASLGASREGASAVVAPDLPGFGATPPPAEVWGSSQYAAALERLFAPDGQLEAPAVIVGHSFGGRVAVTLARRRPDLVGALVLTGVPLLPRSGRPARPRAGYRLVRRLRRLGLVDEQRMERARQRYGSADYGNAQGVMRGVLVQLVGERYDDELAALAGAGVPTELVWADDDTEAPLSIAEAVSAAIPGSRLTRCPGAGHLLPVTAPADLRAAVERALERLP